MKKTLYDYRNELATFYFDKKKVQGLVKRANKDGYDIYYAYHEDGESTWRSGWSESDYKENDNHVKLFEATNLIGKKKPAASFTRAQTYTAECVIFVFCPLETLLADPTLREMKIESVKNKAAKYAEADYKRAVELQQSFEKWHNLPEENKAEITRLVAEISENMGQPGSRIIRHEKEKKIEELGGKCLNLTDWQKVALSFYSLESYTEFKQNKAVETLLAKVETVPA